MRPGKKLPRLETWYRAYYDDGLGGKGGWLNYFFEIEENGRARYLSVGPLSDKKPHNVEIVDQPYVEFKYNILDFFKFEKVQAPSRKQVKLIIKGIFE